MGPGPLAPILFLLLRVSHPYRTPASEPSPAFPSCTASCSPARGWRGRLRSPFIRPPASNPRPARPTRRDDFVVSRTVGFAALSVLACSLVALCLVSLHSYEQDRVLRQALVALSIPRWMTDSCTPEAPSPAVAVEPPALPEVAPAVSPVDRALASPLLLNVLGPPTNNPVVLWDRAAQLSRTGLPVIKMQTTLSQRAFYETSAADLRVRLAPPTEPEGSVRLLRVPADSLWGRFGLMNGDILTAINGRAAGHADAALQSFQEMRTQRMAVLEVLRDNRWLIIRVQVREDGSQRPDAL